MPKSICNAWNSWRSFLRSRTVCWSCFEPFSAPTTCSPNVLMRVVQSIKGFKHQWFQFQNHLDLSLPVVIFLSLTLCFLIQPWSTPAPWPPWGFKPRKDLAEIWLRPWMRRPQSRRVETVQDHDLFKILHPHSIAHPESNGISDRLYLCPLSSLVILM